MANLPLPNPAFVPPKPLDYIDPQTFLTSPQLAGALEQCGIQCSTETLATKATRGGGSPFRKFGKLRLYQWGDAVDWVRETMSEPARTTSEHRAREGAPPPPPPSPEKIAAMVEGSRRYNAGRVAARIAARRKAGAPDEAA